MSGADIFQWLAGLISVGLLVYLVYALMRAEEF
jgi:K+-transporting ATPase KdpF subunit